jgi:alkylation response protein AidB-like acyl-CoA dehydrogenase
MDLALAPSDLAFQEEVRAFLAEAFTPDLRAATRKQAGVFAEATVNQRWQNALHKKGWVAPSWPKEYGGTGWSVVQRYIFDTECAEAGTPALPAMGIQMCGPVIMRFGTDEQKAFFLPRILSGEHYWCQGYSEPGSGSDLASLQCKAVRDGDDYVVNGTKIWTTHAQYANWMFLLVRTDNSGKPQAGITFLVMDMKTPGITIKPIITMSGEHEVNQVFFDNVRIPVANRMGAENDGWTVAKYLLEFERGHAFASRIRGMMRQARTIAEAERTGDGRSLWEDAAFRGKYSEADIAVSAVDFTERRVISQLSHGGSTGDSAASMLKLKGTETMQIATELALEALGFYAQPDQRAALGEGANESPIGPDYGTTITARYLNTRAATIYGGSSEVQRNILARLALGL